MDWQPQAAMLGSGATLLGGGLVCRYYGRKWNKGSGFHMMYWIPLEIWGWLYIVIGAFFSVLATAALFKIAIVG
jgi:hypothetical protein